MSITRYARHHCRMIVCCAVACLTPSLSAQEHPLPASSTPSGNPSLTSFVFERLLNTLTWNGAVRIDRQSDLWSIHADQQYRTRLIHGSQPSRQNEYIGVLEGVVSLRDALAGTLSIGSLASSDDRASELGRTMQNRFLAGLEYSPTDRIRTRVAGGYEINGQDEQQDRGAAYDVQAEGDRVPWDEFLMDFDGHWSESLLGRRRPHTGEARIALWRQFGPETMDSLAAEFSTQERSFYIHADPEVQAAFGEAHNLFDRTAQAWQLQNRLRSRIGSDAVLTVDAGLASRTVDRGNRYRPAGTAPAIADARVQELLLSGAAQVDWKIEEDVRIVALINHQSREERHTARMDADLTPVVIAQQQALARRLENVAARTSIGIGGDAQLSASDRLQLRTSATILRYDTPDTLNTDDRDELYLTIRVDGEHRFSSSLLLQVAVDLSAAHLVYLSRLQSANNNWNRVIRLAPRVEYRSDPGIENVLRAEVIGNYTASDFEEEAAAVRSFSFRQASWTDSLSVRLTSHLAFTASGGMRMTERGILRWREFTERPEGATVEKHFWPRLVTAMGPMRVGLGYRFFVQDRYSYRGRERVFQQSYESAGPAGSIEWNGAGFQRVTIEGWRETQRVNGRSAISIPNFAMNVQFPL